jgi:hypothetical protein
MNQAEKEAFKAATKKLSIELADQGLLIEAGFLSLRALATAPDAPDDQVEEMRMSFFAGAQHLFGSIMHIMDEDREPTEADMRRMAQIQTELDTFIEDFSAKHGLPSEKE